MAKFFIPLALLFCLSLEIAEISARDGALPPSTSTLSGAALIEKACQGVSECVSTLQTAPENQKVDANGLLFFTLRYAEDQIANLTEAIEKLNTKPDLTPMVQSAFSDCIDYIKPLGDLMEDAINALFAGVYRDAVVFVNVASVDVESCGSSLKSRIADKTDQNVHVELPDDMLALNAKVKLMLTTALTLLKL